jgi:hypothetical protein
MVTAKTAPATLRDLADLRQSGHPCYLPR